jgi:hypothetical protein
MAGRVAIGGAASGVRQPRSGLRTTPGNADDVVHRAVDRGVVVRENGVAAGRLADAPAPVGRDPLADPARARRHESADHSGLHEEGRAGQGRSMSEAFRRPCDSTLIFVPSQPAARPPDYGGLVQKASGPDRLSHVRAAVSRRARRAARRGGPTRWRVRPSPSATWRRACGAASSRGWRPCSARARAAWRSPAP